MPIVTLLLTLAIAMLNLLSGNYEVSYSPIAKTLTVIVWSYVANIVSSDLVLPWQSDISPIDRKSYITKE